MDRFPARRALICRRPIKAAADPTRSNEQPCLVRSPEALPLRIAPSPAYLTLLRNSHDTLVSLKVKMELNREPGTPHHIELPKLKHLEIDRSGEEIAIWPFDLKTPVLESYTETSAFQSNIGSGKPVWPLHKEVNKVKHLASNNLPLSAFTNVRLVRLTCMQLGGPQILD